jgi:hypothetical protein
VLCIQCLFLEQKQKKLRETKNGEIQKKNGEICCRDLLCFKHSGPALRLAPPGSRVAMTDVHMSMAPAGRTDGAAPFYAAPVDVSEATTVIVDAAPAVSAVLTAPPVANSVVDGSPPMATAVVAVVEENGIDRPKRTGGGRPKGSKDKVKRKAGGGRPKGAKDKKPRVRRSDKEGGPSAALAAVAPSSVAAVAEDGSSGAMVDSAVPIQTGEAVPEAQSASMDEAHAVHAIAEPAEAVAGEETIVSAVTDV